jgi:hypothetical protein
LDHTINATHSPPATAGFLFSDTAMIITRDLLARIAPPPRDVHALAVWQVYINAICVQLVFISLGDLRIVFCVNNLCS